MSVYVDHARIPVKMGHRGIWRFSHMIADTRAELDEMAEKIQLDLKWKQKAGERQEHFDVTENYRSRVISLGGKPITVRELAQRLLDRDLEKYLEGRT